MSQKVDICYFYNNFGKCGPVFILFTIKFRKELWKKLNTTCPQICYRTTVRKISVICFTALQQVHLIKSKWCRDVLLQ